MKTRIHLTRFTPQLQDCDGGGERSVTPPAETGPCEKSGVVAPPCHRTRSIGAFTLLEMVAVLAIISLLAALLLPRMIKRIDLATHAQETANLAAIHEALKLEVLRNGIVPDENGWAQAAARWSSLPSTKVTVNSRRFNRIYYRPTSSNPATPYAQTTNGTSWPANLRAIVVSTLGGANAPTPAGGVLSDADFNTLWNTPEGAKPSISAWSGWTGTGDDFLIQRVEYGPLFHRLLLVNRDAGSTWFTINGSPPLRLDHFTNNNAGWYAFLLEGTVVGLCNVVSTNLATHILTRDISFVFEAGLWRAQLMGVFTGVTQADEFANEAAGFLSAQWNAHATQGADQASVLTTMYSFMYVYTLWANQRPAFPTHGISSPGNVPEYQMLQRIGDSPSGGRLNEFSSGLVNRKKK